MLVRDGPHARVPGLLTEARRAAPGLQVALGQHVADENPVPDPAQGRVGIRIGTPELELECLPVGTDVGGSQRLRQFGGAVELDVEPRQCRSLDPRLGNRR